MTWYGKFETDANGYTKDTSLDGDDGVFVPVNISLWNVSEWLFLSAGLNNKIIIAGSAATASSATILFYLPPSNAATNSSLTVESTGQVRAFDGDAVIMGGRGETVRNAGLIAAEDGLAISFSAVGASTESKLVNSGTIRSNLDAIEHYKTGNETLVVTNTGLIESGTGRHAYYAATETDAKDLITNSGTIRGAIFLGKGEDLYDGKAGKLYGSVSGGDGKDKLYGGSLGERFDGGAGDDTITGGSGNDTIDGGLGNDSMAGNAGADIYSFTSALNAVTNVDTISGFSSIDSIYLSKVVFAAAGPAGTLASAAFWSNATGLAHDASDRIIYETDTGNLYYDPDGTGAAGGTLFAKITGATGAMNAGDFFIT